MPWCGAAVLRLRVTQMRGERLRAWCPAVAAEGDHGFHSVLPRNYGEPCPSGPGAIPGACEKESAHLSCTWRESDRSLPSALGVSASLDASQIPVNGEHLMARCIARIKKHFVRGMLQVNSSPLE